MVALLLHNISDHATIVGIVPTWENWKNLCKDVWSVRPSALVGLADQGTFTFNGLVSERESNRQSHRVTNHNRNCSASIWWSIGLEKDSLNFSRLFYQIDKNLGFMTEKKAEIIWTWGFGYLWDSVAPDKTYWEMLRYSN